MVVSRKLCESLFSVRFATAILLMAVLCGCDLDKLATESHCLVAATSYEINTFGDYATSGEIAILETDIENQVHVEIVLRSRLESIIPNSTVNLAGVGFCTEGTVFADVAGSSSTIAGQNIIGGRLFGSFRSDNLMDIFGRLEMDITDDKIENPYQVSIFWTSMIISNRILN